MNKEIDEVDKKIISKLCDGTNSYKNLAEELGVSRNTVYRRIKILKEKDIIKDETKIIPNLDKMGYTFISLSINLRDKKHIDDVIDLYLEHDKVTMLFETFGHHDLIIIAICEGNEVGESVKRLENILTEKDIPVEKFEVCSGIRTHKMKFIPSDLCD